MNAAISIIALFVLAVAVWDLLPPGTKRRVRDKLRGRQ